MSAAHLPHSLPSFAQAFSTSSLSDISISNALPPIHSHPLPLDRRPPTDLPPISRKRSRHDPPRPDRAAVDPRQSPNAVRIKQEDRDDPQSPPQQNHFSRDSSSTPGLQPFSKKRRVTVSGAPNTSIRSSDHGSPVPISPVVSSLPVAEDVLDRDQARPLLAVKQQQKTLVEQRRASITAVVSSAGPSPMLSAGVLTRSPPEDPSSAAKLPRVGRISPSTISAVNRATGNAVASGSNPTTSSARPLTPPPIMVPTQQPPPPMSSQNPAEPSSKPQQGALAHSLPPPPISFARRRAAQSGGRKKKPADILISPRDAGPSDPLAPVIQSAPPVADPGRFPMAIPRLPLVLGNAPTTRRVAGNVPPTPTRFSLQDTAAPSISSTARTMHSPPNVAVPMANTFVPPTPHALHHPNYMGDKTAFLAPFEVFYDALNDSKQLKSCLSDQLQKSNALMMSLKLQQEKLDELVEDLVEKRTRVMQEEITMLRQRMESLEEGLLAVRAEASARGQDSAGYGYSQGAKFHQSGVPPAPEPPSSYRFPAADPRRPDTIVNVTSPGREQEHQQSSPPPLEVTRRLSVSAISATTARPEPVQTMHGPYTLGSHSRGAEVPQGSAKGMLPSRTQAIPERSSTARQTDTRTAPRSTNVAHMGLAVARSLNDKRPQEAATGHKNHVTGEKSQHS